MRWILKMKEYDFIVVHKPGESNAVADALSRDPTLGNNDKKLMMTQIHTTDERNKLIMDHHIAIGHANSRTTYKSLKNSCIWKGMREDVCNVVKECRECLLFNTEN